MNVSIRFLNLKHCSSDTFPTTGGNWSETKKIQWKISVFISCEGIFLEAKFFLIILNLFRIIIDKLIEHEIPLMPFGIWLFAKKIEEKQRRLYFKQVRHSSIYGINSWKCHCETQARYRFILLTEFPQEFCQQSVMTVCKVQNARPYSIWVGANGLVCCLARELWNWNWHNVLSAKWCGKKDDQKNKKKKKESLKWFSCR